jgi:RNA 3'-terminal phosphate cyclase (ATP)
MESSSNKLLNIDGSILEGGGQILRISLAMSVLKAIPVQIDNIRGKRDPSGLKNQHTAVSTSLAEITNSEIKGAKVGSKALTFIPGDLNAASKDNFECDCQSAGSIGLMIQQTLPCLLFANRTITLVLKGGTIVSHAPSNYYITDVLIPILNKMNIYCDLKLERHGIFPIGQGRVNFECQPVKEIIPLNITERGNLQKVLIRLVSTGNFMSVKSEELKKSLQKNVKKELYKYYKEANKLDSEFEIEDFIKIDFDYVELTFAKNKCFTLFGQIVLYFDNTIVSPEVLFSEKKEKPEVKNFEQNLLTKFNEILYNDKICFDEFTVDHLIIFMALANGASKISLGKISLHTETAIEIIKKFDDEIKFDITKNEDYNIIEINGKGMASNKNS